MITLCLRTDKPISELYVYDGLACVSSMEWEAHRSLAETLHVKIEAVLASAGVDIWAIEKIVVFRGPGSFTGLRIGISVANALAYALRIPVIGAEGDNWLSSVENDTIEFVPQMPLYGSAPHITQQKK